MNSFDPVLAPQNSILRPAEPTLPSLAQALGPVPVPQESYPPLAFAAITIASAATIMKKGPEAPCASRGTDAP